MAHTAHGQDGDSGGAVRLVLWPGAWVLRGVSGMPKCSNAVKGRPWRAITTNRCNSFFSLRGADLNRRNERVTVHLAEVVKWLAGLMTHDANSTVCGEKKRGWPDPTRSWKLAESNNYWCLGRSCKKGHVGVGPKTRHEPVIDIQCWRAGAIT